MSCSNALREKKKLFGRGRTGAPKVKAEIIVWPVGIGILICVAPVQGRLGTIVHSDHNTPSDGRGRLRRG